MNLCENKVFLELKEKAVKLVGQAVIGECCTVDCIIGVLKKYDDDLAADKINEKTKLAKIMEELKELELIDLDCENDREIRGI